MNKIFKKSPKEQINILTNSKNINKNEQKTKKMFKIK